MGEAAKPIQNWATHVGPHLTLKTLLDAAPANDTAEKPREIPKYKWIHCCNEGMYEGHFQGPFNMTRAVFDAFVANFRGHPQFKAGELDLGGGVKHTGGVEEVIQFDYEHASEFPPFLGDIPQKGAPAPAWCLDVEVRNGPDGVAQLWAFAELGDEIRRQIASKGYLWVSIAFTLHGVHWKTAKDIGPVLTSIAFTNHPFMQDLESLAASARSTSQPPRGAVRSASETPVAPGSDRRPTATSPGAHMDSKLRDRICKRLNINLAADDDAVGDAVDKAASTDSALGKVLEALDVKLPGDALEAIPKLRAAQSKLEGVMKELRELLGQEQAADAAQAPLDAAAAMSAQGVHADNESIKKAFTAQRQHLVDEEVRKVLAAPGRPRGEDGKPVELTLPEWRACVAAGRKAFLASNGADDPSKNHLGVSFVAAPGGQQLTAPTDGRQLTVGADGQRGAGQKPTFDPTGHGGRNVVECAMSHLRKTDPAFKTLSHTDQVKRAWSFLSEHEVVQPQQQQAAGYR